MSIRTEVLAGHTHPRHLHFSFELERADQFHQNLQQADLLLPRQMLGGGFHHYRPIRRRAAFATAFRCQMNGHDPVVRFGPDPADQMLAFQCLNHFRCGRQFDGEFLRDGRHRGRAFRHRVKKPQDLDLKRADSRLDVSTIRPIPWAPGVAIGIADIDTPEFGGEPDIRPGEVPLFWACGVTPQTVIEAARPPFCITHKAGHMLVTDRLNEEFRDA